MFSKEFPVILLFIVLFSALNMAAPYFFGTSIIMTILIILCLLYTIVFFNRTRFFGFRDNVFYFFLFTISTISFLFSLGSYEIDDFMHVQYGGFLRLFVVLSIFGFSNIDDLFYLKGIRYGILLGAISIIVFALLKIDVALMLNDISTEYQTRFSGFYLNANYGGVILAIGLNVLRERGLKVTLTENIIIYTAIFFTFSFTAIVIVLIGLYRKNKILFIMLPLLAILYLVLFWDTFNFSQSRYKKLGYLNDYLTGNGSLDNLFTGRMSLWNEGFQAIASNPFFGNGFGFMSSSIKTFDDLGIHNSYLEILGDFGLLLGPFILISLFMILNLRSNTGLSIFISLLTGHGLLYTIPFCIFIKLQTKQNKTKQNKTIQNKINTYNNEYY